MFAATVPTHNRGRPSRLSKATPREFYDALHEVADAARPEIRDKLREAFRRISRSATLAELADAAADRDVEGILRLLRLTDVDDIRSTMAPVLTSLHQVFVNAAQTAIEQLPKSVAVRPSFTLMNPEAVRFLQDYELDLITNIGETTREGIRAALIDAFEQGIPPRQLARRLRDHVGLTPRQTRAVENHRKMLMAEGMSGDRLERAVERYRERQLRYRTENIARTETIRASNAGQHKLWEMMQVEDDLPELQRNRRWVVTRDDRLAVAAKTPVMTIDGWKHINDLKVGDRVLTHKDRFMPVTAITVKAYNGPVIRFDTGGRARIRVTVTPNHPLLIDSDWIDAENVRIDDNLTVLAKPCPGCGDVVPSGPGRVDGYCKVCVQKKVNSARWSDPAQHAKLSQKNRARWSDPDARMAASKSTAALWQEPEYVAKQAAALPGKAARMSVLAASGLVGFGAMTYERRIDIIRDHVRLKRNHSLSGDVENEAPVARFLSDQGIEYVQQWEYWYTDKEGNERAGFADFYLPGPRLIIECVGQKGVNKERAASLAEQGIEVLQFSTREILDGFSNVASEIRQRCCFMPMRPKEIRHYNVTGQTVYDIQVAGDESFVAGGIVVHNCPICRAIPGLNPDGQPVGQPFKTPVGPVLHPPAHPMCRCAQALVPRSQETAPPVRRTRNIPDGQVFGDVSDGFRRQVEGLVDEVPVGVRSTMEAAGGRVAIGGKITDVFPELEGQTPRGWPSGTWNMADGLYDPDRKFTVVTETRESLSIPGRFSKNDRTPEVFFHEYGHALDRARGVESSKERFQTAYRSDMAELERLRTRDPRSADNLEYFVQGSTVRAATEAGASEAFAEAFAISAHGRGASGFDEAFRTAFPNVMSFFGEFLRELQ